MSRIDDLIAKYCPKGIEYVSLGKSCEISTGKGITTKDVNNDGLFPIISGGVKPMGFYDKYNRNENTVTIVRAGTAGFVDFIQKKFWLNDKCFSIIPLAEYAEKIHAKFMFYYLKNKEVEIIQMKSTGSVPTINTQKVSKILIPVPPLPVQQEIVRILDSFSELEKELEKELETREKQYEYYRNQLLSFGEGGDHACDVKIGTVKDIVSDSFWIMPPTPKYITVGIPYITSKNIGEGKISFDNIKYISHEDFENISAKRPILPGDILISMIGTLGNTAIVSEEYGDFYGQNMFLLRLNPSVMLVKYFMYFFNSVKIKNYLNAIKNNSGQGYLKTQHIENLEIPIPPLAEQERIVAILDKFDALVNDISVGLPAEIDARRKQYEYYREKLLTFPKAE